MSVSSGVVTLGQIAGRLPLLEVFCNRCDHRSQVHESHTAHGLMMSPALSA
jgi:hypothetical protein